MAQFLSGRKSNLKLGITSSTEDKTVLEVIGKVSIGITESNSTLSIGGSFEVNGVSQLGFIKDTKILPKSITLSQNEILYAIDKVITVGEDNILTIGAGTTVVFDRFNNLDDVRASSLTANYFYGNGSNLTNINAVNLLTLDNLASSPVYPIFANNLGITSVGIQTTKFVYIPTTGNIGIGTTYPTEKLSVSGNISINDNSSYGSILVTTQSLNTVGIHSVLPISSYRSVEYTIQASRGNNYHLSKILSIHNGTITYNSEYGSVYNNGQVAIFDVDISGGNIRLLSTPTSSTQTNYIVNFVANKL